MGFFSGSRAATPRDHLHRLCREAGLKLGQVGPHHTSLNFRSELVGNVCVVIGHDTAVAEAAGIVPAQFRRGGVPQPVLDELVLRNKKLKYCRWDLRDTSGGVTVLPLANLPLARIDAKTFAAVVHSLAEEAEFMNAWLARLGVI
jgi:hypothetical protein